MRLFGLETYMLSQISHKQSNFESLRQYYFGILLCLGVQSHPEDHCDFGQGSTVNIWECNNQLELSVYIVALTRYLLIPMWNLEFNSSLNEDIYENCANLSKVTPVYGTHFVSMQFLPWLGCLKQCTMSEIWSASSSWTTGLSHIHMQ